MTPYHKNLTRIVRSAVHDISMMGPAEAAVLSEPVRIALRETGLKMDCHVGLKNMNEEQTLEWHAGQLLHIVFTESWFEMKKFINSVDQYAPEVV